MCRGTQHKRDLVSNKVEGEDRHMGMSYGFHMYAMTQMPPALMNIYTQSLSLSFFLKDVT